MTVLPATGTAISMGRMGRAYYNGTATVNVSVGNAGTRKLNSQIGRGVTTTTAISSVYGGRTAPFTY
jgi:hypothetical protein